MVGVPLMGMFVLGIGVCLAACWLGYWIISIVETRINEEKQWKLVNQAMSHSSPSQRYWANQTETLEPSDDEVLRVINPRSQTPDSL